MPDRADEIAGEDGAIADPLRRLPCVVARNKVPAEQAGDQHLVPTDRLGNAIIAEIADPFGALVARPSLAELVALRSALGQFDLPIGRHPKRAIGVAVLLVILLIDENQAGGRDADLAAGPEEAGERGRAVERREQPESSHAP